MSIEQISSRQLGRNTKCRLCQAGSTISFNWQYALKNSKSDLPKIKNLYVNPQKLKTGTLYQCKSCGAHWYLDADKQLMNFVQEEKLDVISRWSETNLKLKAGHILALNNIGETPPDLYGNGSKCRETPCQVKTKNGDLFECAIVTIQSHAPFEEWREYKLASEIEEISESAYALPLDVRLATTQADEIRMGFAPTIVELSNGERSILNLTTNFLKINGISTSESKVCSERIKTSNMPPIYQAAEKVVYFVADPSDLEINASNKALNEDPKKPSLNGF